MAKKQPGAVLPKLTASFKRRKTGHHRANPSQDEVVRPASANRNTVKALEEHGLISSGKGRDPLTIVWHIKTKAKK